MNSDVASGLKEVFSSISSATVCTLWGSNATKKWISEPQQLPPAVIAPGAVFVKKGFGQSMPGFALENILSR